MTSSTPPEPTPDELTLALLRSTDGEGEGARRLLAHHGGPVLAALQRGFGGFLTRHELEDAIAAAVVRIWAAGAAAPPANATLRSWLYVIARNCLLSIARQRRRRPQELPLEAFEHLVARISTGPAEQERLHRLADLHNCLRELPSMQRAVLAADLDANGTADADTLAARLGTTARVVYVARSRGRAEIRRMMQRLGHFAERPAGERPAPLPAPEFG